MRRSSSSVFISGQVYGRVDWVTQEGEVGMFINVSSRGSTRCIITGSEVKAMVANNLLSKGMMLSAHGELFARARYMSKSKEYVGEVVCDASRLVAEPERSIRTRGSIYGILKSTVMHWSKSYKQIKSFSNFNEKGRPKQLTCSVYMKAWVEGLKGESRDNFESALKPGRSYTASCLVEVSTYVNREKETVPVLQLLPLDFALQG